MELVKLAKETLKEANIEGQIFAADASTDAPTKMFCDKFFNIPRISDPLFMETLLNLCKNESVDILIPTIDTELSAISENAEKFAAAGTLANISSPETVNICRNKILAQRFFENSGIKTPKQIPDSADSQTLKYPLFIKPLNGSSSINAFKINNAAEFDFFKKYVPNPIIQEMIEGVEYTSDVFCDENGSPVTIVPRNRISVRSGEILKGKIEKNAAVIEAVKSLLGKIKFFGHITIQCIKRGDEIFFIEINPRFGGGAPMSIRAGANSILNLIKIKNGEKLSYNENYRDGLVFSRFDDCVIIK